ncbi:MAG: hypothetical protein PHF25_00570 [Candidatus Margulisbacteria bacterium]|nr:hypothetical protein [Candidatus Margulisiibacteriota bacterium]
MLYKICSLNTSSQELKTLRDTLTWHREGLQLLAKASNEEEVLYAFTKYLNIHYLPSSLAVNNGNISENIELVKDIMLYYLFHSLPSILKCSDVVIYQTNFDQIFGETQGGYLWVQTKFVDKNYGSRFTIKELINDEPTRQGRMLNVYTIQNGGVTHDFAHEEIFPNIEVGNGISYVEIPAAKNKEGKVIEKKQIQTSGSSNISILLDVNSPLGLLFLEFNQKNSKHSIATDSNDKTTAIFHNEARDSSDLKSSMSMLHSPQAQTMKKLFEIYKINVETQNQILTILYNEGIMLEVRREQEFEGIAGLNIIARAHNANYYIELIINALEKNNKVEVKNGLIWLDNKPMKMLNQSPDTLKERIIGAKTIIEDIEIMIDKKEADQIRERATAFERNKKQIILEEQKKLKTEPFSELQVCYFAPININEILPLLAKEMQTKFLIFIKENGILLTKDENSFLNVMTLGRRSQLLNGLFEGNAPKELQKMLEPKLKGKVICKPVVDEFSGNIQTHVVLIFDKPIHKSAEELLNPIFIKDELSYDTILLDPRYSSEDVAKTQTKAHSFSKSPDGTTLSIILDYDIWSYPERKVFFRFCEGVANTLEYEENNEFHIAKDIPNILLSKERITIVRNPENFIMNFFENLLKTRRYSSKKNTMPFKTGNSVLADCLNDMDHRRRVLSYFIRNHINDKTSLKIDNLLLNILSNYLVLNKDDALFATYQLQAYQEVNKLGSNPFYMELLERSQE